MIDCTVNNETAIKLLCRHDWVNHLEFDETKRELYVSPEYYNVAFEILKNPAGFVLLKNFVTAHNNYEKGVAMIEKHRHKVVAFSMQMLQGLFTGEYKLEQKGLPADAEFIELVTDSVLSPKTVFLIFEHETFEPVPAGETPPLLKVEFRRVPAPSVRNIPLRFERVADVPQP